MLHVCVDETESGGRNDVCGIPGCPGFLAGPVLRRVHPALEVYAVVLSALVAFLAAARPVAAQLTSAQQEELATYFGFGEMEMYKLDDDISHLRAADINGDGLTDLVVVNNRKSKIELLLQRKERPADDAVKRSSDVNELYGHWRFERKAVPINYRVATLAVAEFSGDDAPDIVFFGEPKELVVLVNEGHGRFSAPQIQRVRDGIARNRAMAAADLNGDSLTDVALLGEKDVLYFYQKRGGGLRRPVYEAHATNQPFSLDLADISGDGLSDVIVVTGGNEYHAHVRHQTPAGELGPQQRFKLPRIRTWEFLSCLGRKQADLIAVESVSGRLRRWQFESAATQGAAEEWPIWFYPFPAGQESATRPLAQGDVDGDGLRDLVSADVKAAQILLYRQSAGGGLKSPAKFGGQVNMRDLRLYDIDGDGTKEVFVCSADEKAIGVSRWNTGRLSFPKPMLTTGEPQACDLAPRSDGGHWFVYVTKEAGDYHLVTQRVKAQADQGTLQWANESEPAKLKIQDLATAPSAVRLVDVDQNGRMDALVFAPYETLVTFLQDDQGEFQRLRGGSAQEGLVKEATIAGFHVADVDADGKSELLFAQRSFARALRVNERQQWVVVDQYNAPTAAAEITGVTTVASTHQTAPNIALYDKRNAELHWLTPREDGTYEVAFSLPVGSFELKAMTTARLSGAPSADILVADAKKFALLLPELPSLKATELTVYESKTKDAYLRRPAVGDLNHDGRSDIVITDATESHIEVLTFGPQEELVLATRFKVFATKQFRQGEGESREPREVLVCDLNADQRDDLALITHDRVIIYPAQ